MKLIFAIARTALFIGGSVMARSVLDWDADASGDLLRDEWSTGMSSSTAFSDWDADTNGTIDPPEFAAGLFDKFDADSDGSLTSSEWEDGFDRWYGEQAVDLDFATWDSDGDGSLSDTEFTQQYDSGGLFDTFRTATNLDASADDLTEDQFSDSMFDWMDSNRDDMLAVDENTWEQQQM